MTRREYLLWSTLPFAAAKYAGAADPYPSRRPPVAQRRFTSHAVEDLIASVKAHIADPKLAWMFENCLPNTLDTTVHHTSQNGQPDTFVITGDIDAMWLRDSSAQVWPYLPLLTQDAALKRMIEGLIRRQTRCILIDPYANAFMPNPDSKPLSWAVHDDTKMHPGVGERKWEIDSLCYPIRLAHRYWKISSDAAPFEAQWGRAARLIVATFREQQRRKGPGSYSFQRASETPTDTQALGGFGNPTRPNGMIHSMFRPSDDACVFPLFVPANHFAVTVLGQLAEMVDLILQDATFAAECRALAEEVSGALARAALIGSGEERVWVYEVDGFGNQLFMDDANTPGLLGLPYLGCCAPDDPVYRTTRAALWSARNPYFFSSDIAEGLGGPHEGLGMIWPMSITLYALTSQDSSEVRRCLDMLKRTDAGTGFMHESFHRSDPAKFTRPWFAWANSLFGELILTVNEKYPNLLTS